MPAIWREARRKHVIADHRECLLAVTLTIAIGGLLDIGIGRLPPAVESFGDKDEHATDDRSPVPGGDARIYPGRDGRDKVQRRPPARFSL